MVMSLTFSHTDTWVLTLPPHTRWSQLLRWIDRHEAMVYRWADGKLRLWLPREVGEGFLEVTPTSETDLHLSLFHRGEMAPSQAAFFLSEWWDLTRDLSPFYESFQDDPLLGPSLQASHGARIVGFPDLFEALVIGILGQQVNVGFAYRLKQRLTDAYGHVGTWQGERWWRFPQPERIAEADISHLREMQISQRKAEYLLGVAGAMAEGQLSKASLMMKPWEEQMATLTALRGIGNWTAQYVCMKCLHSPQAFPAGDAGLQNAVKRLLHMDRKPTVEELYELAQPWAGWEAYATWFLWMGG